MFFLKPKIQTNGPCRSVGVLAKAGTFQLQETLIYRFQCFRCIFPGHPLLNPGLLFSGVPYDKHEVFVKWFMCIQGLFWCCKPVDLSNSAMMHQPHTSPPGRALRSKSSPYALIDADLECPDSTIFSINSSII
jgi:hypothetical protein